MTMELKSLLGDQSDSDGAMIYLFLRMICQREMLMF